MDQPTGQPIRLSLADARRLAISSQRLAGGRLAADEAGVLSVVGAIGYLQLDPVSVVAPSHEIVLWSRLGPGAVPVLEDLLWHRRRLFEHWVYAASIVPLDEYPLYRAYMDGYPSHPVFAQWMDANHALRSHILDRLAADGPLPTSGFEDRAAVPWQSTGWTAGRNVERMLQFLWQGGKVMVAGRSGGERWWALTEAHLPADAERTALPMPEAIARAAELAVRGLGVARAVDVKQHFFRNQARVPQRETLDRLARDGRVVPVDLEGSPASEAWFAHAGALETLAAIQAGRWEGRTALLSPFDNLVSDRGHTERLWRFAFRNEMYVPKAKRQYGYYVLPVLHGDRLVGRIAARVDRSKHVLRVEGLYPEPDIGAGEELYRAVTGELAALADMAGATSIACEATVPQAWRTAIGRA